MPSLLLSIACWIPCGLASAQAADPADPPRVRLTEGQTQLRVVRYEGTEGWALRGLVLLSLGSDWHPMGARIVEDALTSDVPELRLFALETLVRTSPSALRCVLTTELIDALVERELAVEALGWRMRAVRVLRAAFPDAKLTAPEEWQEHWKARRTTFVAAPWTAPPVDPEARSVASSTLDRAFDLEKAGLELVLCIDSTGSMQGTIDAAAAACDDVVRVLASFSPRVRVGLVHYGELGEIPGGAQRLLDLTSDHAKLRTRLRALVANGGGDFPERVEKGLEVALDGERIDWTWGANKLVIVVGDAPPHDASIGPLLQLARDASKRSRGRSSVRAGDRPTDGRSHVPQGRPATICCIGVGSAAVDARTEATFRAIARAGSGTYVPLTLAETAKGRATPSDRILEHVLRFAFGPNAGDELDAFVEVLLRARRRGWLR
ncbi:MAG: VWA domain-containing protein [Planctomycetota bacterium]